ncbi:MAG: biliverdin-producing heme oxygenase [Alphaproteobacteria bacterium]|nr:biliverdin-producing heme oxygenase [Alphaproteobacteria bacterium]MBU1515498.1 biliverdin-producing heme oxygenase [Alphaproteobacteria bacterium]MBU2095496.1 biliverdin-producing heme oxygenase [Alphaproteobacteria bacterium]MBU2150737.1 biliverdin-producing heme oxygenase [Alphaproteobacteria bacterium]MBU2307002.1 biliverdin-producing heme oxygenase [Alphaproteobacteria bacterium]
MISEVHGRLRDATRVDHDRLEARMDILARIVTAESRRELVERFHGLHAEAEAALAPSLASLPGLDFETRRRSVQLAADLATLGGKAVPPSDAAVPAGVAEALGRMYVLEGSTLGGRVIRRTVEARGDSMVGLSFLDPYGDRVGERWRAFLAVLDAQARTPDDVEAMVRGAVAGFHHAERRLCDEPVNV